jgi:hypothetical protein
VYCLIFRVALCALLLMAGERVWADQAGGGVPAIVYTPIQLVDGPTISIPCPTPYTASDNYLTLMGNNRQILFPNCPASSNGLSVNVRVNAGNNSGSAYTGLIFAPGFNWTGLSPYAICTGIGQPNPLCPGAEVANQVDWFVCKPIGTTSPSTFWDCLAPQYNVGPPSFALVASNSCFSASGGACTTSATNMTGANLIVGCLSYYNSTDTSAFSDSLGSSYSSAYSTAQANVTGSLIYAQGQSVSSSMTFTASAPGGTSYPSLTVMGFSGAVASPLDQNNKTGSGGVTTLQPGSITPTQANELLVSCLAVNGTNSGASVSSPFTIGPVVNGTASNEGVAEAYQIQAPGPTAVNPTWTWSTAETAITGQASFK